MTKERLQVSDEFPRSNDIDRMNPAEICIVDAMSAVNAMPADTRLTQAETLLQQAKTLVSDYVDATETYYQPGEPLSASDKAMIDTAWSRHKAAIDKEVLELSDADRAAYWQRAYERMAARNAELSAKPL